MHRTLVLRIVAGLCALLVATGAAARGKKYGGTALAHAVFNGEAVEVREAWSALRKKDRADLGAQAVWHAIEAGRRDILELLIELGAPSDYAYSEKISAVEVAVADGCVGMARYLVENGARGVWRPEGPGLPLERAVRFGFDLLVDSARRAGWNDASPLLYELTLGDAINWHQTLEDPGERGSGSNIGSKLLPRFECFAPPWSPGWAGTEATVIAYISAEGRTCMPRALGVEEEDLAGYLERLADGLVLVAPNDKMAAAAGSRVEIPIRLNPAKRPQTSGPADSIPVILRAVLPAYVGQGRARGRVVAEFKVITGGTTSDITIVQTPSDALREPTRIALEQFLFFPAFLDGEVQTARMALPFTFE